MFGRMVYKSFVSGANTVQNHKTAQIAIVATEGLKAFEKVSYAVLP